MIKFVICGIEHSGTTLVSDLFRQLPQVDAGFEVGVLLGRSPREFPAMEPFAKNILSGWKISEMDLAHCCATDDFSTFYARLQAASGMMGAGITDIFDKTPRYLAHLDTCTEKARVPFIVMYKDPRAIVFSDFARSKERDFAAWFAGYAGPKLKYMQGLYAQFEKIPTLNRHVLPMSLEQLCMEPRKSCEALFGHCGYDFNLDYFLLKNLRFQHTRSDSISARIPFEYMENFSAASCRLIADKFKQFPKWFYE